MPRGRWRRKPRGDETDQAAQAPDGPAATRRADARQSRGTESTLVTHFYGARTLCHPTKIFIFPSWIEHFMLPS